MFQYDILIHAHNVFRLHSPLTLSSLHPGPTGCFSSSQLASTFMSLFSVSFVTQEVFLGLFVGAWGRAYVQQGCGHLTWGYTIGRVFLSSTFINLQGEVVPVSSSFPDSALMGQSVCSPHRCCESQGAAAMLHPEAHISCMSLSISLTIKQQFTLQNEMDIYENYNCHSRDATINDHTDFCFVWVLSNTMQGGHCQLSSIPAPLNIFSCICSLYIVMGSQRPFVGA